MKALLASVIEESEKNDDRDRNPKKPQQDSSAHDRFLSTVGGNKPATRGIVPSHMPNAPN